jgi:hypothetical protein
VLPSRDGLGDEVWEDPWWPARRRTPRPVASAAGRDARADR